MTSRLEHPRWLRIHPWMSPGPAIHLQFLRCLWLALSLATATASSLRAAAIRREELFDGPILTWEIQLSRGEMAKLRGAAGPFTSERPEALCTVRAGGQVWTNVAIHLKGAAGSFRQFDQNPALTLNFGKVQDGQTCFGHRKLHLNNSIQDAGRMDELLASEMYLNSGVPTPRATHGFVHVNGRRLGLYVVKGGWDKPFLKQHFGSSKGNFYDGEFSQDIDSNLRRASGEGETDWADLDRLRGALKEQDRSRRLGRLAEIVDVERFISFTAIQVLIDDWDGYARQRNNYRIYNDPTTGRLVFMPHGMDQLWRNPRSGFSPRFNGVVASSLFGLEGMSARLVARMRELTNTVYNAGFVDGVFERARTRLVQAYEKERRHEERQRILSAMEDTRDRIRSRMASFNGEAYQTPHAIAFDPDGRSRVRSWTTSQEGDDVDFSDVKVDGKRILRIEVSGPGSYGSWRARLNLPPGRYRFETRARTIDVRGSDVTGRGRGAGIRISGNRRGAGLEGSNDWRVLRYDFGVPGQEGGRRDLGGEQDAVLIAELRADSGVVEFDADSMVLSRINDP